MNTKTTMDLFASAVYKNTHYDHEIDHWITQQPNAAGMTSQDTYLITNGTSLTLSHY